MTDEKLIIESGDFRSAGHRLQSTGESLTAAYAAFLGGVEREGNPWGGDVYGSAFADGEGKYQSAMRRMRQAAEGEDGYLALLGRVGENTVATADQVEAEDQTGAANLEIGGLEQR